MRFEIFTLFCVAASINALPVVPGATSGLEDLVVSEQQILNPIDIFVSLLRSVLAADQPRTLSNREGLINPYELLSLANSFLSNLVPRNNQVGDDERDATVQDPRVLNYEKEINRRNQVGRLARVFTSLLFR